MFSPKYKPLSVLGILMVPLTILLCFPWAAIAQFGEQRLIPLAVEDPEAPPLVVTVVPDIPSESQETTAFVVYGRETEVINLPNNGILREFVDYRQLPKSDETERESELNSGRMPDLETFFGFGGTLELLTRDLTPTERDGAIGNDPTGVVSTLNKHDLVISEIMWAIDEGFDENAVDGNLQFENQVIQWIELYNTTGKKIENAMLYFLFTPFRSHPLRETVESDLLTGEKTTYKVLDTVDTLFTGLWKLPGKRGDRPDTAFVSAYRKIDYDTVEDIDDDTVETDSDRAARLAGIPFGSDPNSWAATPASGRRNTDLKIIYKGKIVELLVIGTPGAKHVTGIYIGRLERTSIPSDTVVINEVRNDTSKDNVDWVELKNVSTGIVDLKDWELSIVKGKGVDNDLVKLPEYELGPGEILLLLNKDPWFTPIAGGANINDPDQQEKESARKFLVDTRLNLPDTGKFVLLLRNKSDQNGKDEAIQDYAGNGFFEDFD